MTDKWIRLSEISPHHTTPAMRQYLQAKMECEGSLLFFRMGDFYELFFEDAVEAAEILNLALTSRDGPDKERRVPMAGVPVRAVDSYIAKLVRLGKSVSICEQMENPKDVKGIVKRQVVRTVTPGTVLEPELLDDGRNNYLAAIAVGEKEGAAAFVDMTTGEFLTLTVAPQSEELFDELARLTPAELLMAEKNDASLFMETEKRFPEMAVTRRPADEFDPEYGKEALLHYFQLKTLEGLGGLALSDQALACAGAVVSYLKETQRDSIPQLDLPRHQRPSAYVALDANTQRNLELTVTMHDKSKRGSLLGVLDKTLTGMGERKLRHWILHPLSELEPLQERLDAVTEFYDEITLRLTLRDALKGMPDIERLLGRITASAGNARDVLALGTTLAQLPEILRIADSFQSPLLQQLQTTLDPLEDITSLIERSIADDPPLVLNEGNLIREGYHEELDRLRDLVRGGVSWIARLQQEERERTGIAKLKVGFNRVFGYYIEISRTQSHLAPDDYERKQTLANAERFITPSLKKYEEEILTAQEKMQILEYDLFVALRSQVAAAAKRIRKTADALASLDLIASLAEVAATHNYCRPELDKSGEIEIADGRHPVVEDINKQNDFVPNDTRLGENGSRMLIMTGPNMAGKSTYLRQVALICLMAQMGSYVPASKARIGLVDRIFTRVGASDNLVRGESTFMVEMIETAAILNSAGRNSLLVLDEIGRGTSTYDGISIAWSVAEYIHDAIQARTLFATHYHELTELGDKLEHARNISVSVRDWQDTIVFLYRVVDGGADHSYGIQVAKLAGLPQQVLKRAHKILESLEAGGPTTGATESGAQQMYLFAPVEESSPGPLEKELEELDVDALSPREAQAFLYHLKHLSNRPRKGK
ncbi:MAG: DNA mismatch repair protein MutS [Candidatus Hydrogenedens sp.]|jgi:DNA mismatch repair protein MutS|nr:DNA mismatch repair protein MutS [Candidatus Hydrogenedens sp.]